MVDEGHRTQYKLQAEAMRSAIPNGIFFAFTGTPIDKKDRSTYRVFGPLLDRYSFDESKEDGATLTIFYEGRMPDLFVEGIENDDSTEKEKKFEDDEAERIFERIFADLSIEEKAEENIKSIYKELKDVIISFGLSINVKRTAKYIAFIHKKNFVDIVLYKSNLTLFLNMKKGTLNDPKKIARDVSNIGHWGNGDYEIKIKDSSNLSYIISLIRQSYDSN